MNGPLCTDRCGIVLCELVEAHAGDHHSISHGQRWNASGGPWCASWHQSTRGLLECEQVPGHRGTHTNGATIWGTPERPPACDDRPERLLSCNVCGSKTSNCNCSPAEYASRLVELSGLRLTDRERTIANIAWLQGARHIAANTERLAELVLVSPYERADFPLRAESVSPSSLVERALRHIAQASVSDLEIRFFSAYPDAKIEIAGAQGALLGRGETLQEALADGCERLNAAAEQAATRARADAETAIRTLDEVRAMLAEVKS